MATSEVQIVNLALQKLGAKTISSLSPQNHPNARAMSLAYAPVRDRLMRKYDWNFCKARASIAADSATDTYEGLNRFRLPNDFARLLRRKRTGARPEELKDWQIEGQYILTHDAAPLEFRYCARAEDPALFDSAFVDVLAAHLAVQTAKAITGSNTAKADAQVEAERAESEARQVNAFENPAEEPPEDPWLQVMR